VEITGEIEAGVIRKESRAEKKKKTESGKAYYHAVAEGRPLRRGLGRNCLLGGRAGALMNST